MANFGVKAGKLGAWFRATKEEITSGIIPGLWIAETGVVLAICGFAIHRKLKSYLSNKDEEKKKDREIATSKAKGTAMMEREIAIAKAKSEIETEAYAQTKKIDFDYHVQLQEYTKSFNENPGSNDAEKGSLQLPTSWIGTYMKRHPLPELPGIIGFITKLSPGIQIAALLNTLSMFGAMCFSKVRAEYLDKKTHAPNLQVVIEGMSGSGKDFFKRLYDLFFDSITQADAQNIGKPGKILSTIGVDTSTSSLHEICADNQEVHLYIQESEIKHVTKCMKDKKGVSEEMLRYAFDNDYVTHTSKNNKFRYHIFLNYTFTGTPNDVEEFIKGKESDGNASRIAWASIPESQVTDKAQELPDGANLELILGNINLWREQYCFETDKSGKDTAVKEVTVDLSYINAALKEWLKKQEKFSRKDDARASMARRYAAMAFHCAMILHVMMGCPVDIGNRKKVVDLTIYLADYLIESFLNKFGDLLRESIKKQREKMGSQVNATESKGLSDDELEKIIQIRNIEKKPWKVLAFEHGTTEDALKKAVERYRKKKNKK